MKPYSEIYKIAAVDSNQQAASSGADIWAGLRDAGRFANRTVGNILQAAGTAIDAPISVANNVINYPLYLAGKKFLGPNHGFTRAMQPKDVQLVQRITTPANRIVHQQNQYQQPDIMRNPLQKALGATAQLSAGLVMPIKGMKAMKAAKPMTSFLTKAFPKYGPRIANWLNAGNQAQDKVLRTGMKIGTAANAYDIADDQLLGATYTPQGQNNPERAAAKHIIGTLSAANPKAWMMKKILRSTPAMQQGVMRPAAKLTFGPYTQHVLPTVANAGQQVYRAATSKPVKYVQNNVTDYLKNDPVAQSLSNVVATSPAAKFVQTIGKPMVGYEDKKKQLNAIMANNYMQHLNPTQRTRQLLTQRQKDMQVYGKSNISLADVAGTLQPSTLLRTTVGQTNKNKQNMNRIFSGIPTYKAPYAPAYIQQLQNAARNGNIDITGVYDKLNTAAHAAGTVKCKYDQINNSLTPAQRAVIHNAPRAASAASSVYKRHQQQQQQQQQQLQQPQAVPAK